MDPLSGAELRMCVGVCISIRMCVCKWVYGCACGFLCLGVCKCMCELNVFSGTECGRLFYFALVF